MTSATRQARQQWLSVCIFPLNNLPLMGAFNIPESSPVKFQTAIKCKMIAVSFTQNKKGCYRNDPATAF